MKTVAGSKHRDALTVRLDLDCTLKVEKRLGFELKLGVPLQDVFFFQYLWDARRAGC